MRIKERNRKKESKLQDMNKNVKVCHCVKIIVKNVIKMNMKNLELK